MLSGFSDAFDVVQVGIADIGELILSQANQSQSDIKSPNDD